MLDIRRHQELFEPHYFTDQINIIGSGATGSWIVSALTRLGIKGSQITVWDFDKVESHNVPNQAFGTADIGHEKAAAIAARVQADTGAEIKTKGKYTDERLAGYVILAVDSMSERKRIYEQHLKMKPTVKHIIEPRLGMDISILYNVNPMDLTQLKAYEDTYYTDEEAETSACGASLSVVTSAMQLAAMVTRQIINHHNDEELDNEIVVDFIYNNILKSRWS